MVGLGVFITRIPLPLASVPLGGFIVNPHDLAAGKFPSSTKIDTAKAVKRHAEITDFSSYVKKLKGTKLEGGLADLASVLIEGSTATVDELSSCRCVEHYVDPENEWFEDAVEQSERLKMWLERQAEKGRKVYMIAKCRTLQDAAQVSETERGLTGEIGGSLPLGAAVGAGPISTPADPNIKLGANVLSKRVIRFKVPGEKVFAIYCRQVKLYRHKDKEVDSDLLPKGHWYELCGTRTEGEAVVEARLEDVECPADYYAGTNIDGDAYFSPGPAP